MVDPFFRLFSLGAPRAFFFSPGHSSVLRNYTLIDSIDVSSTVLPVS